MTMPKGWMPGNHPVRDPRSTKQEVGRVVNPPAALVVGGKGNSSLFDTERVSKGGNKPNAKGPVSDRGRGGKR